MPVEAVAVAVPVAEEEEEVEEPVLVLVDDPVDVLDEVMEEVEVPARIGTQLCMRRPYRGSEDRMRVTAFLSNGTNGTVTPRRATCSESCRNRCWRPLRCLRMWTWRS
jgi:hypothetical protein